MTKQRRDPLANEYGNWERYIFTREQLSQYISLFTGQGGFAIADGTGSTHMPTKVVHLPIGDIHAQDVAAHEGTHVIRTDPAALDAVKGIAGGPLVLNVLEDARMEREEWRRRPGLKALWQDEVDDLIDVIKDEDWLPQILKSILFDIAGYRWPGPDMLKPKAKRMWQVWVDSGLKWEVRKAASTMDLVPIVPRLIALFDEEVKDNGPQPQPTLPPSTGCEFPVTGGIPGFGSGGDPVPTVAGDSEDGETDETDETVGSGTGDSADDLAARLEAEEEAAGEAPVITRKAREYDVDDERHLSEAAERYAEHDGAERKQSKPQNVQVDGYDKATGGPKVNRLVDRAHRMALTFEKIEQKIERANPPDAKVSAPPPAPVRESGDDMATPDAAKPFANPDSIVGRMLDLSNLPAVKKAGVGIGYRGTGAHLHDYRSGGNRRNVVTRETVLGADASIAALANYLGRQMRIWLQSQDRLGMRDHERYGIFDPRRGYAMGAGRFDVYRNPPKVRPKYPVVALSVDMSSSMGGFWYGSGRPHMADYFQTGQASYHAMLSAMLVARALQAIRCPFEVTGFGGGSDVYMMKSFGMPYNDTAKYALGGIYTDPNGGTPAAEGLALAYARVMTRPEQRKVIIQITDAGVPENTRRLAHALRDDGITVIGIGIGTDDERTRKYYGDGFAVEHAQELPSRFVQLLRRLSINGELR